MKPYIFCNLFLFDAIQSIMVIDKNGFVDKIKESDLQNLAKNLSLISQEYKIDTIQLNGNPAYAQKIIEQIKKYNNKIQVEVN